MALVNSNELICCDDDKTESLFYSLMSNKVKKAQVLYIYHIGETTNQIKPLKSNLINV